MADIVIEPMRAAHLPGVMAIEKASFSAPWTLGMFVQELEDNRLSRSFVALDGSIVAGYMLTWFLRDEVHLLNIAVDPDRRRRGVGGTLVAFLLDLVREERRRLVSLEVRSSNTDAIRLYQRYGFVRVGVRRRYYEDNHEDAVVMAIGVESDGGPVGLEEGGA